MSDDVVAVGFVDADGVERHELLEDAALEPFETGVPVRSFPSYRGQRNWPGWWWSATTGAHVGYESWLERDHAMALDFDLDVVGFAAQPFWLFLPVQGRSRSHAPDFFVRHRDGSATVIDCRPATGSSPATPRCSRPPRRRVSRWAGRIGAWARWSRCWRRTCTGWPATASAGSPSMQRLLATFAVPRPLMEGASWCGASTAVLPVAYHLLWHRRLHADLTVPLTESSPVATRTTALVSG